MRVWENMRSGMKSKIILAAMVSTVICLGATRASALILTGEGNTPVTDAGWPEGTLALANLKTRAGWWEGPPFGGGEWHFLYRGNTDAFNDALAKFAAIRAPALELVIHDGPPEENPFLKDSKTVNWTFTVWVPANWHRLYNNPKTVFGADSPNFRNPVAPPRMDVYVGDGGIDWSKVSPPKNVHITDQRAFVAKANPTAAALVRVEVFDIADGKPIRGTKVIVASMNKGPEGITSKPALRANGGNDYVTVAEGLSDESGRVMVTAIPAGPHRILIEAPGYAARVLGQEQFGEHTYKTYSTELAKVASVRSTATDSDGKPLAGIKVRADHPLAIDGRGYPVAGQTTVETDASGAFVIEGLPTGYCQLWAYGEGYHFGDVTTIYDTPATNVTLVLQRAGAVEVVVKDSQGNALSRFENNELMVFVEPKGGSKIGSWGGGFTVKNDGTVDMKDVPPGEYRISSRPNPANSNKEYAKEQIVTVKPGATTNVKIIYE
jgi:hypothetical protein